MTNDQILSMARAALNILGTILLTYGSTPKPGARSAER